MAAEGRMAAALTEESARYTPPASRATRTAKLDTRRRLTVVFSDAASDLAAASVSAASAASVTAAVSVASVAAASTAFA